MKTAFGVFFFNTENFVYLEKLFLCVSVLPHTCLPEVRRGPQTGTEVMDGSATLWILASELEFPAGASVALN